MRWRREHLAGPHDLGPGVDGAFKKGTRLEICELQGPGNQWIDHHRQVESLVTPTTVMAY
ncbi:hypothetical protein LG290_04785 [Halomonas sediminis]